MNTALKEWSVIVQALKQGRHHFLLRKGGLADKGQTFTLSHSRFLFFPTFEHQKGEMIRPEYWQGYHSGTANIEVQGKNRNPDTDKVELEVWAESVESYNVNDLSRIKEISDLHVWSDAYLKMRWEYHPEKPLILVLLRVYTLDRTREITNYKAYGGCRSWVDLKEDVSLEGSRPVLTDDRFNQLRRLLRLPF